MNLLLLRHAESEGNASGNYSTAIADSLSDQGEQQALALVDTLKSQNIDRIIVSPLRRTIQTIAPYLMATDQRAEIWPEIAEACWHDEREEPTKNWKSQPAHLPDSFAHLFAFRNGTACRPAHPESFGEGLCRVRETLDRLRQLASQSDDSILMVTHGHFIRETINLVLGIQAPIQFAHDNCGMTLMSFNGVWTMEFCNRIRSMK